MRLRSGQILEIETPCGLAYVQYVSRHRKYGDTIRVLPGQFSARPTDFARLAREHSYFAFYPAGVAVAHGLAVAVAIEAIPAGREEPGLIRRRGAISRDGHTLTWLIVDGDREVLRRALTADEKRLPIAAIWNHAFLVDRLAEHWSPEMDGIRHVTPGKQGALQESTAGPPDMSKFRVTHYLYFPAEDLARGAVEELTNHGFEASTEPSRDTKDWLVLAKHGLQTPGTMETFRALAERAAEAHAGRYDGSEAKLS